MLALAVFWCWLVSRQKYSYLPIALMTFIFAVIGEMSFIGVLGLLAVFGALVAGRLWVYANLTGELLPGLYICLSFRPLVTSVVFLGPLPLSGKPRVYLMQRFQPSCRALDGWSFLMSVSRRSRLRTEYDEQRASWSIAEQDTLMLRFCWSYYSWWWGRVACHSRSRPRQRTKLPHAHHEAFCAREMTTPSGRDPTDASGRRGIDLGPSASDRLRGVTPGLADS